MRAMAGDAVQAIGKKLVLHRIKAHSAHRAASRDSPHKGFTRHYAPKLHVSGESR